MEKNVVITIYYTKFIDPQRNNYKTSDNFKLISGLYNSVNNLNMKLIIFYDSISDKFIKKYQNDAISFVSLMPFIEKYNYEMGSMNDIRFLIYRDYLLENPIYTKVLITDLFDEEFLSNPFDDILSDQHIYANYDRNRTYEHYYIVDRINKTYGLDKFEHYKKNKIIQASMFAGYYNKMIDFLNYVKHEFDHEVLDKKYNNNYIVLNYVFNKYFGDKIIFGNKGLSFKTKCGTDFIYGTWKKKKE